MKKVLFYTYLIIACSTWAMNRNLETAGIQLEVFKQMVESEKTIKQLKKDVAAFALTNKLRRDVVNSSQGRQILAEQILKIWKSIQKELDLFFENISLKRIFSSKDSYIIDVEHNGVDATNCRGETALYLLASEKNKEFLRLIDLLLDNDARIDKGLNAVQSPLMVASWYEEYLDAMHLLIKRGANVNWQNKWGETSLARAVYNANLKGIELLLNSGAYPFIKNSKDQLLAAKRREESKWTSKEYELYEHIVKLFEEAQDRINKMLATAIVKEIQKNKK